MADQIIIQPRQSPIVCEVTAGGVLNALSNQAFIEVESGRRAFGSSLQQQIGVWQAGGSPVYVSGHPSSEWNLINSFPLNSSTQTDPFTILERGHALRQNCLITGIEVNVYYLHPPGGLPWEFKLFFWNGTGYECKASQAFTPTGSGVVYNIQSFAISPAIAADEGDIPALYIPLKHATVVGTDGSRNMPAPRYLNANVSVGEANAFTSEVTGGSQFVNILTKASRPYIAWLGDSIVGSGNGVYLSGDQWRSDQENSDDYHTPGGSPGNQLCDIPYQFSLLGPSTLRHQSIAKGGSTFATLVAAGAQLDRLVLVDPAVVFIHCGVNDVATGRTWSAVEADLNTIRAALSTKRLFLDEILPYQGDDTTAATIRTWNANYATWCAANNATLVRCHDEMAVTRVSTGQLDDLNPTYSNGDSVHLSQAGAQKLAQIERRYLPG